VDLRDAVLAENEQLRVRVSALESGLSEYRRQMDEVLSSLSWRLTSPLRVMSGRARRLRTAPQRFRRSLASSTSSPATSGLFPPSDVPVNLTELVAQLAVPPSSLHGTRPQPPEHQATSGILVVAHVYYPEVWSDIADRLARMPAPFDLVVTLVVDRADWLVPQILGQFPGAKVEIVPNRGRDIAPLVSLANRGFFDGYEAILKVHTKRSPHRIDGDGWRIRLLDSLLESPSSISHIVELIRRDPSLGLVVPTGHVSGPEHWGRNKPLVEALASRLPMAYDADTLAFAAGSMFWCRPWVLQRLADLCLSPDDFQDEAGHTDGTTAHALERMVGLLSSVSGLDTITTDEVASRLQRRRSSPPRPTTLAFYLPQYHRVAENDEWWGEGFTDWRNVAAASRLFPSHAQPLAPTELGEYDLGDVDVMRQQAALARQHGVDGFVMHHYWFDGRPLLERPMQNLLSSPDIDFPFALCWANESWTRRWDGLESDVLLAQTFSEGWQDRFFDDLLPALRDPRYLHVGGKPLLVVYRVGQLPHAGAAIVHWKARAVAAGLGGLHVLAVGPSRDFEAIPADAESALDGLVHFPPLGGIGLHSLGHIAPGYDSGHPGDVLSYDAAVEGAALSGAGQGGLRLHPGVMPGWDNTARRGPAAYVFHGSNPLTFRRWMSLAARASVAAGPEPLIFINAWNEWAEGAHLEPDARFGRGFLEAVGDVLGSPGAEKIASGVPHPRSDRVTQ